MHGPAKNPLLCPSDQAVRTPCCKGCGMPPRFSRGFFTHLLVERCSQLVCGKSNGLWFPLWVQAWRCFALPGTHIWGKQEHKIWMEGRRPSSAGCSLTSRGGRAEGAAPRPAAHWPRCGMQEPRGQTLIPQCHVPSPGCPSTGHRGDQGGRGEPVPGSLMLGAAPWSLLPTTQQGGTMLQVPKVLYVPHAAPSPVQGAQPWLEEVSARKASALFSRHVSPSIIHSINPLFIWLPTHTCS